MKIIKLKYNILLNGFPKIENEYKIHEFSLKEGKIDESYFENIIKEFDFNHEIYRYYSFTHGNQNELYYNYLENEEYIDFKIPNQYNVNKNNIDKLMKKYPELISKVNNIITEMRLCLNIPVSSHIIVIQFMDDSRNEIGKFVYQNNSPFWNRLSYIETEELINNSRFKTNIESFYKIKNERYQRAITFFNESFDSEKTEIRFIKLITTLECLFNYKLTKEESITKRVSTIVSSIMGTYSNQVDNYYNEVKKMYNLRSRYLHGDNSAIDMEEEKKLRKYTRIVLLVYSLILINKNYGNKQMISYLSNPNNFDLIDKTILSTLLSKSFSEQQLNAINIIKSANIDIPESVEKNILSKI